MRKKRAAIFDIDGTLLPYTSMDRIFFKFLIKKRIIGVIDIFRMIWFCVCNFSKGFEFWLKKNKAYLKNKDPEQIAQLAQQCFYKEIAPLILPEVKEMVLEHRKQGDLIIFLSAALQSLVDLWTFTLEGDIGVGTVIEVKKGKMTGKIEGVHSYGDGKVFHVERLAKEKGFNLAESFGYGEHLSDKYFLELVGHPVVIHPSKSMRVHAKEKGWLIISSL